MKNLNIKKAYLFALISSGIIGFTWGSLEVRKLETSLENLEEVVEEGYEEAKTEITNLDNSLDGLTVTVEKVHEEVSELERQLKEKKNKGTKVTEVTETPELESETETDLEEQESFTVTEESKEETSQNIELESQIALPIETEEITPETESMIPLESETEGVYHEEKFEYFKEEKEIVTNLKESGNSEEAKSKAGAYFKRGVDFVIYGSTEYGVTFKELTEQGKKETIQNLTIIGEMLKLGKEEAKENIEIIDEWIMELNPDYKENISNGYQKVKDKAKEQLGKAKNWISSLGK